MTAMIVSPAISGVLDGALTRTRTGRPVLERIAGWMPLRRQTQNDCAWLVLDRADAAALRDIGLTRQHLLQPMAQEFGR
jgi:hypothetical protein